jgi:hypothetical protein
MPEYPGSGSSAREAIKKNEWVSNAGDTVWELSGGMIRCAQCGVATATNRIPGREARYYRCTRRYGRGVEARSMGKNFRGETTEAAIWDFVSGVLKDPERLRRGLDEMLAREHSPSTCSVEEKTSWFRYRSKSLSF